MSDKMAGLLDELLPNWWDLLNNDECPRCGRPLDTGWECAVLSDACGFDAQPLVKHRMAKVASLTNKEV